MDKDQLQAAFLTFAEKFDALSQRERVLSVVAAVAVVVLGIDFTLSTGLASEKKRLTNELSGLQGELTTVETDIQQVQARLALDPTADDEATLAALRKTIGELDALLDRAGPQLELAPLLRELLDTSVGLELASLKTLPVEVVAETAGAPAPGTAEAPAAPAAPGAATTGVYRYGVELSIAGNYLDMLPYLQKLQDYPTLLFWSGLKLEVGNWPEAKLDVTVQTLSRRPSAPIQ